MQASSSIVHNVWGIDQVDVAVESPRGRTRSIFDAARWQVTCSASPRFAACTKATSVSSNRDQPHLDRSGMLIGRSGMFPAG